MQRQGQSAELLALHLHPQVINERAKTLASARLDRPDTVIEKQRQLIGRWPHFSSFVVTFVMARSPARRSLYKQISEGTQQTSLHVGSCYIGTSRMQRSGSDAPGSDCLSVQSGIVEQPADIAICFQLLSEGATKPRSRLPSGSSGELPVPPHRFCSIDLRNLSYQFLSDVLIISSFLIA